MIIELIVISLLCYLVIRHAIKLETMDERSRYRDIELLDVSMIIYIVIILIPFFNMLFAIVIWLYSAGHYFSDEDNLKKFFLVGTKNKRKEGK